MDQVVRKQRAPRPTREAFVKLWNWIERNKETLAGMSPREIAHAYKADTGVDVSYGVAKDVSKRVGVAIRIRGYKTQARDKMQTLSDIVLRIAKELGVQVSDAEAAALKP